MKFRPFLRILIALCFASLGFASDGCKLEEFKKVPSGLDGVRRYWLQVKLKTPLRKETTLFVQPDDIHGVYDVFVTGFKEIYLGIPESDVNAALRSICPDLFANGPLPSMAHALAQPQAAAVHRRFGQMSANTAPADVNGDGILDAVELSGNVAIVTLLKADGSILSSAGFSTVRNAYTVIAADFNGDGKLDLAVGGDSNGTDGNWLGILLGNGDGTFQPVTLLAAGNGIEHLAAVDLNGDGKMDLVAANPYSNRISVLLGNGDGTFRTPVAYDAPKYPSALVVTDLNDDGRPDVAVLARFGDQLGVFLSNGTGR